MSTYRAASPYGGLSFDFESYEAEVEKGKQRVIIVLIMNMIFVSVDIVVNQLMLAQQTRLIVKLMQTPAMISPCQMQSKRSSKCRQSLNLPPMRSICCSVSLSFI